MKSLEKDLVYVDVKKISFDPLNPRGEKPHQILTDKEFSKLVDSIKQYGLLEPLIVKKDDEKAGHYILIDGERRLRAAKKIADESKDKSNVPALVAKDEMDGRILAYQVHMLRKNWNKAAETKAIKQIIVDIKAIKPKINEVDLKKEVKEITAHKEHEIDDILKMIKFGDEIIEEVINGSVDMSYLVQIESSFIRPLARKYPSIMKKYGEDAIRQTMAQKAIKGLLKNTRFLMDKFKDVFNEGDHNDKIEHIISTFIEEPDKKVEESYQEYTNLVKHNGKKGVKSADPVKKSSAPKKVSSVVSRHKEIKVSKKQQTFLEDIRKNIEGVATVLSKEEYDYIAEGLFCLESSCFKAAVLMLWATAISKTLKLIDTDLADFNSVSQTMKSDAKSVWKHFSRNFKCDYVDLEEIRVKSDDVHLLCYLCFKKIISVPEFKKLKSIYDMRNDCAHPTSVQISTNEAIASFENIYNVVLNNPKIK